VATLSLDLSGESLHRRGYREDGGLAPLKENLAAAILLRAGWPEVAVAGGTLLDPMCGSGTLLLEGALMAADIAPGLLRGYFGFLGWRRHQPALWEGLIAEAEERRLAGLDGLPPIFGSDSDPRALRAARANAARAGLSERVSIIRREVAELLPPEGAPVGLVVTNPPYGERLGEEAALVSLYETLGRRLKEHFGGWRAAVFTGNPGLASHLALRAHRRHAFDNGALRCRLLHFTLAARPQQSGEAPPPRPLSSGAEMFANRLRKNLRALKRWVEKEQIDCYRLYDADMPEYAVAVDWYQGWVLVQEYAPPPSIDALQARRRLREVMAATAAVLDVPRERLVLKVRRRQKGTAQYDRLAQSGAFQEVGEGGYRFLVNLTDYLDTGLFLDHRLTRALVGSLARGKDVLNLFAYTGTASVYAAGGGARSTVSVDLSRTYLEWAERNLRLNGFTGPRHRFIQGDCLEWLAACRERFGLIFLDPPTFSNSKRMSATFDVQRDHVELLRQTARLLDPEGVLIFSNNNRRFRMDREALSDLAIEEITAETIPPDFARNLKIHNCWRIVRR
jgi:23S rRNA (guanine2445-N2)-methyltransferase / 23S rRNA (guanine2069-N7)-methyltransferase